VTGLNETADENSNYIYPKKKKKIIKKLKINIYLNKLFMKSNTNPQKEENIM
jgi:hypothetical protein